MLHATGGDARFSELARVNAFSWLTEFQHFQQPDVSYPGDSSCGFPAHALGVTPFDNTYLVHLGDHLDSTEFDAATRSVAEYLRLNTITSAKAFFEACRKTTDESAAGPDEASQDRAGLRSFGIFRRSAAASGASEGLAHLLSKHVIAGWQGDALPAASASIPNEPPGAALVRRLRLDADGIFANVRALLELQLGTDAASFVSSWLAQPSDNLPAGSANFARRIDPIFCETTADDHDGVPRLLGKPVKAIVAPFDEKLQAEMRRWIIGRLDVRQERLAGARQAIDWLNTQLTNTDSQLRILERTSATKIAEINSPPAAGAPQAATISPVNYFGVRLDQLAARAAAQTVRLLSSDVKALSDELTALSREIAQMGQAGNTVGFDSQTPANDKLLTWIRPRLAKLADEVDQQLAAECLREQGLWITIMQGGRRRAQLTAKLHDFSRQAVLRELGSVNVMAESDGGHGTAPAPDLRSNLSAATPALLELGGTRRVLAILPRDGGSNGPVTELLNSLGMPVSSVIGSDNSMTLCVEAAGLQVRDVAVELVQRRRDRVEFAGRVQSRTDITWTPLLGKMTETPATAWAELSDSGAYHEQAMAKTMVL
jgi:hypothetical protein